MLAHIVHLIRPLVTPIRNAHKIARPFLGIQYAKNPSNFMSDSEEDRHIDKKRRLLPTLDKQTKADKQITIDEQTATDAPIVHTGQNSTLPTEWPEQSSGSASLLGELSSVLFGSVWVPNAPRKHKGASKKKLEPFSKEDIITKEVMELLGEDAVQHGQEGYAGWNAPYKQHDVVELTIARLSSHGMSLRSLHSHCFLTIYT